MLKNLGIAIVLWRTLFPFAAYAQAQTKAGEPLSLKRAEELLIQRNLSVVAARQQIDIAEAARRIAGLRSNPNLLENAVGRVF